MSKSISNYQLFHSDCGGKFANNKLQKLLEELEVTISMSKPGYPYDNALSENMFKLLKNEGIDDYYTDINKLYADVRNWVNWLEYIQDQDTNLQYQ